VDFSSAVRIRPKMITIGPNSSAGAISREAPVPIAAAKLNLGDHATQRKTGACPCRSTAAMDAAAALSSRYKPLTPYRGSISRDGRIDLSSS